jgi:LPS-assembly lipoprotein
MLSFRPKHSAGTSFAAILAFGALAALSGCQVRPLYSTGSPSASAGPAVSGLSVAVGEVNTRYAQEVRNHLIFLLNGGAAEPESPLYRLDLGISKRVVTAATVQVDGQGQPIASGLALESNYILLDAVTGSSIATGKRAVTASFDRSRQQFSQLRAEKDAEDRAAKELAEVLQLAIAGDLANRR